MVCAISRNVGNFEKFAAFAAAAKCLGKPIVAYMAWKITRGTGTGSITHWRHDW